MNDLEICELGIIFKRGSKRVGWLALKFHGIRKS